METTTGASTDLRPFRIDVPQEALDDLGDRLARARFTDPFAGGASYGVTRERVMQLAEYWRTGYDWRRYEVKLNRHPQFTTTIDGQNIHFIHFRSTEPGATPLILTHGWPMSVAEYVDLIPALTDPASNGGDPADAFDVVIPSIPGFAFSGPTTEPGWSRYRIAKAWAELMRRLGYERYGAAGNDAGSLISPEVGRSDPEHVVGVHVTQVFSFPSGDPAEFANLSAADMEAVKFLQWFWENMGAYNKMQSQAPMNLAHALADSPVGQLAWSLQLFGDSVPDDYILDNVTTYWLTNTGGSSARLYYEDAHAETPKEPTTVPLGLANFAYDFQSIRPFAERDHRNIVSWNVYEVPGHYAAQTAPDVLVRDIREFFRKVR